ncbi:uncharacterized protein [Physcomitrium patens]|uniref:uncharacterized protein isoform X1 n=1 Tax=Physcomitrium patens TaxID=3218 RepID=UPI000D16C2F3|nr:adenylate kinase isoenzyme 1-like isoform X1 [Physcomitrium patens]XP_024365576.1 adenylate kinase isoenzyme 1-like isoform X1 [Physcomitrium patens]XP_024365578.1 adenylate kinase isoenzyme 1-like isoform X1 [Physcomitrium patens]XP_024365579.1 adenylate kinase isoenzyme 1-like isoform X1 [Physcomitrium patens]XP_024365580.1 adenylate kinase isoenzyme 1-like isoform X1 [Physcomitrium patens]XP_024365581.1 adenylate kinase isoenzyme 1-like isoform X1 [Physcomitrium patens]XP_024365582.1 ad|eukprot:XP_024365575.1 adenylate kinase isoenzyme 1-like isoform X1 [Physcomitrella patens]
MGQLISSEPRVGEPIEEKEDANEDEDEAEIEPEEIEPETVSIWDMGSISSKVDIPEDDKPIIFVIGGPGTGKGTQCSRMAKEFGFKHISIGELLREEMERGTLVGKECSEIMKDGKLVPLKLTLELIIKAIKAPNNSSGYLLDGFPRATNQARAFQKQVRAPTLVLYLHAPQQVLLQRLMQRGLIGGRTDDNPATIRKRFITFKKESLPVVAFYEKTSISVVKKVCTITAPDDVYRRIRKEVKSVLTLSKPPRKHIRRRVAVAQKEAVMSCLRRMKHRRSKKPRNGNGSQNLVPLPPPLPPPPPPTRASPPQGCHIM